MKTLLALILALLMLCACGTQKEPVIEKPQEEQPSLSEPEEIPEEKPEKPAIKIYKNLPEKIETTHIQDIQLFSDYVAYIYGLNKNVNPDEPIKETISSFELETGETEILSGGNSFF